MSLTGNSRPLVTRGSRVSRVPPHYTLPLFKIFMVERGKIFLSTIDKLVWLLCRINYVSQGFLSFVLTIFNYFKIGWVLLTQFWLIWGFQHLVRWNWQNLMFGKNKVLYKNCRTKPRPETTSWFWILDPFYPFI